MGHDSIRTARSKGITETRVVFLHALKNALLPIVTVSGWALGLLLDGTIIIEMIFVVPDIGAPLLQAITARDYILVMGDVLVFALAVMLVNLAVDMICAWLASAIEPAAPRPSVLSGITGGLLSFVSRKPLGAIGAVILIIAVLLGGFRPGTRHFPAQGSARYFQVDPPRTTVESVGKTYWLGSDQLGRDTWSRLVYEGGYPFTSA